MGKFDQVLIASDFDNTLVYTETALQTNGKIPPVSEGNRLALEYFMAEGGTFCMATGRALPAFAPLAPHIPMNGPSILFNGAAIYDFSSNTYLHTAFLPEKIRTHVQVLEELWPSLSYEIYHDDNSIFAVNPSDLTNRHLHLTHSPTVILSGIDEAPSPISKLVFNESPEKMSQLYSLVLAQPWVSEYEVVLSTSFLLELTAHGANKGGMLKKLAALAGKSLAHTYAVGDHANDISMLETAAIPFAPKNAIESVHQVPGIHILPDAREDAISSMIAELDKMY